MQKISKSIHILLPSLKVYEDEICEIFNLLTEYSKRPEFRDRPVYRCIDSYAQNPVSIETLDHKLFSVDELKNLPSETEYYLQISCIEPHISITLDKNSASIYCQSDTIENEGVVRRIEKILLKHHKVGILKNYIVVQLLQGILIGSLIPIGFIALFYVGSKNYDRGFLFCFLFSALALLACLTWYHFNVCYSTVIFKMRKETPSFWKRNKDKLIMLLLGIVLGNIPNIGGYFFSKTNNQQRNTVSTNKSEKAIDETTNITEESQGVLQPNKN